MKYIVFGLGNFGKALSLGLTEMGHEVIGVDKNMKRVEQIKEKITHAVCLDSTDREAVESLPLKSSDAAIVAIGEDEASSLLTTALLKQMNVKRIIGRVVSDLQRVVLEAMSITEFILPEEESAERLALRLHTVGVVDSFKISEKYSIVEALVPDRYIGKTVGEADFNNRYKVIVLTTIRQRDTPPTARGSNIKDITKYATGIATSNTRFEEKDILVLFGEVTDIQRLLRI